MNVIKSVQKCAKGRQKWPSRRKKWVSPWDGQSGCHFWPFWPFWPILTQNVGNSNRKKQANCIKKNLEYCTKPQKKSLKACKNAPREAQNSPASVKSEPRWTKMGHVEPPLPTSDPLLATWGSLTNFKHFYEVFVINCAFFLKIRGNPRKIKQIALKIINIAQKHRKNL